MQHQHGTFHDRRQVSHHLRMKHDWTEPTRMVDVAEATLLLPADQLQTADGGYVIATSELLATHRELHELTMLDEMVRGAR